ncbi:MAG: IS1096 element passenger TnpR family protein [Solirubrobacteraceae bacterium]
MDLAFARWNHSHLHCFEVADGSRHILGGHDELDPSAADSQTTTLQHAGLARIGVKLTYTFDLGDDWTDACAVVAQDDPPDFSPRARIHAHQPAGPHLRLGNDPTDTAACATTTNMIPGPIPDHASLPGEHPVARPTRRSLSATCLGASHGRSARRVPSARSRLRRRTATAQAHARA